MATGTEAADQLAALLKLGTAVLPVVSALAGVALGGWLENRRERSRREYEQSIRFHDERLAAYIAYWRAISSFFASTLVWSDNGEGGKLIYSPLVSQALGPYNEAISRVNLLASQAVRLQINAIHDCVRRLTDDPSVNTVREVNQESLQYRARAELGMRIELGIK